MTKLSDKDFINAEVITIEESLANKDSEIDEVTEEYLLARRQASKLDRHGDELRIQRKQLESDLKRAKDDLGKLKRSVWISDDPNVIELRNQLLLAAKLVKDNS